MLLRTSAAIAALLFAILAAAPGAAQAQSRSSYNGPIRCESVDNRDSYCAAETRAGVNLKREYGRSRCVIGRSWGYDRGGIWVSNGCSAEFEIGTRGSGYGWGSAYNGSDYAVCESKDYQYQTCAVDIRGGVTLINQVSRSPCIQGQSWGFDRRGIWVDSGCAGEFQIGSGRGSGNFAEGGHDRDNDYGSSQGGTLTCESKDNRRRICPANLRGYEVRVLSNLSRVECIQGRSWDFTESGIWVDQGCRATFSFQRVRGYGSEGAISRTVRCSSKDFGRTVCDAAGNRGVRLSRQISDSACVQGRSWNYDGRSIWVDQGCSAEFEVQGWR